MMTLVSQLSLILLLLLCSTSRGFASGPIPVDDSLSFNNISRDIEYIEDAGRSLSFEYVRNAGPLKWTTVKSKNINFGFTTSQYGFRFTIDNRSKKSFKWFLEIDFPPLDLIELYVPDGHGRFLVKKTGDSQPFSSRDVRFITYIFRMHQNEGPVTYFLRIDSLDSININVNMLSYEYFMERVNNDMPIQFWSA